MLSIPGIAAGLAVTATGGDMLYIEATRMQGKGHLTLTGHLGGVMREMAQIAYSYVRAKALNWVSIRICLPLRTCTRRLALFLVPAYMERALEAL